MALFKDCTIFYVKCDPKRPNAKHNKLNPTWECQLRTSDAAKKDEWVNGGMRPKLMVYKEGAKDEAGEDVSGMPIMDANGKRQWRVNLKKKSIAKDGSKATPVAVMNGALEPIDPNTIGNGSVANVRVFQYKFRTAEGEDQIVSVLMAIQMRKLLKYTPRAHDDEFEEADMETVEEAEEGDSSPGEPLAPSPKMAAPVGQKADNLF